MTAWKLLRAAWRICLVSLLLLGGATCVAVFFPFLGFATRAGIKQRWSGLLVSALGVRIEGDAILRRVGQGLIVSNHISFIDIFVIDSLMRATFVAKHEVAHWPVIGWLTTRTDNLFVERGRRNAAHATYLHMAEILSLGRRLVVFPEGTTTRGDKVLPFHAALMQSAVVSEVPVVCLALRYTDMNGAFSACPAYVDDDSLWDCLWRVVIHDGLTVHVHFVGLLASRDLDRRHLAHAAHQRIARLVVRRAMQPTELLASGDCNAGVTPRQ